ncbi:MAG: phosphatidylserine decarboxylase family protein [Bacteroidetes bacterium]|nr:phosphatidylserine decarboxylase family protein [Bacteroidota bacterium]
MRLHKAGIKPILITLTGVIILLSLLHLLPLTSWMKICLYIAALLFMFFVVRFFRRPIRVLVPEKDSVYSAADGTVVAIEEVMVPEYFNDKRIQVSVFMSIFDVHVNFFPISGKVRYLKHHEGLHIPAFRPKSSLMNEMTTVVLSDEKGREIMVRQIAGVMARRIVCNARPNGSFTQGDELGIIRFGSRVDILLPLKTDIKVKLHQKVRGNIDLIAKIS